MGRTKNLLEQLNTFKGQIKTCEDMIDSGKLSLDEQISVLEAHWTLQNEVFDLEKEYFQNIYR